MRYCLLIGLTLAGAMPSIAGCESKTTTERKETVSSPGGTTTTIDTHTVESTGQNPPANSQGEAAK
jgi:hypothetical protein